MAKRIIKQVIGPEELKILAKVSKDPFYFSTFAWVVNPVLGRVKFDLYEYQKAVLYQFIKERFNIILKCRQMGITELIALYCLWVAMFHNNKTINIISIKDTVAKKVLRRIKFMYKNLPWYLQTPIVNGRPGEFGSAQEMQFSNGSTIASIPTSEQAGRSESLSLLVIDEAAAVRWANQIWAAAAPTLSCISGSYELLLTKNPKKICKDGEVKGLNGKLVKIKDLAPKHPGVKDLKEHGLYTLTHKGQWKRVISSVNKGKLETWEVVDNRGKVLQCTPAHRLYTTHGWKSVYEILERGLSVVQVDTKYTSRKKEIIINKPKKRIVPLMVFGSQRFYISSTGEVYKERQGSLLQVKTRIHRGYNTLTLHCKAEGTKNWKVSRLVYEAFHGPIPEGYLVDHINNDPLCDWCTNLQLLTNSENIKKSYDTNLSSITSLSGYPIEFHAKVLGVINSHPQLSDRDVSNLLAEREGLYLSRRRVNNIRRNSRVYLSKLRKIRSFIDDIYDIQVEDDHSYILPTCNFINHNTGGAAIINSTPLGTGGWYHKSWVDAIHGVNGINPIRLLWDMHPDRDQNWYNEMAKALGPKRTAQEIDGDFLSSGNTVFDMADIKAIEDCLGDYPILKKRLNGTYREWNTPDPHKEYFIGADVATGRGTDYSGMACMDKDGEEVAGFKGKIPVNKYARLLGDVGERFNFAKIAPESNDIGLAVTQALQDEDYPNLYYSTKILREKHKSKPKMEQIPGWYTTSKNRPVIIEGLEKDIREDNVIIKDPFFTQEAYTFIYDSQGRPIALGKHNRNSSLDADDDSEAYSDDLIFGTAIANHIRKSPFNTISVLPQ